jgi:hypothetical protein
MLYLTLSRKRILRLIRLRPIVQLRLIHNRILPGLDTRHDSTLGGRTTSSATFNAGFVQIYDGRSHFRNSELPGALILLQISIKRFALKFVQQ